LKDDPQIDDLDVAALKALAKGTASEPQQKRALRFILHVSGVREMPAVSENERKDAFNNGRRYVGWMVAKLIEMVGVTAETKE